MHTETKLNFTLKQLQTFVLVARELSFVRAANALNISQPAVSDHIQALEENLNCTLFKRRRGTTPLLTSSGKSLLARAEVLLDQGERIVASNQSSDKNIITLHIYLDWHLRERFRKLMPGFLSQYPHIALDLINACSVENIVKKIEHSEIDLAIVTLPHNNPLYRFGEAIAEIPQAIFASNKFARHIDSSADEISKLPFITPMLNTWEDDALYEILHCVNIFPQNIVTRSSYANVAIDMAVNGLGLVVAMDEHIQIYNPEHNLIKIGPALPDLHRTIFRKHDDKRQDLIHTEDFIRSIIDM